MRVINKILYNEFSPNFWSLALIVFLMMVIVGLDAIAPWPFKILIDNVLNSNPIASYNWLESFLSFFSSRELLGFFVVLVYFLSSFLLSIFQYIHSVVAKKVIKSITADFSKKAFKNLETLSISHYKKQQIGDYIYRLSYDVSALGEFLEEGVLPFITSTFYLLITISIMLLISIKLTLLALIALPFLAFGLYSFNTHIGYTTKRSEFFNSAAFSFIEEALTHLKIIQAFSQEKRQSQHFDTKIDFSLESDISMYRLDLLLTLLVGVVIAISYSFIIIYGIHSVFSGTLTTGLLIVFIFYLDNLTAPIISIIYSVASIKQSYVKISRMTDFFTKKIHSKTAGKIIEMIDNTIVFDHVTLRGDKGVKILSNVSFKIKPNSRTVIFGLNGSGKTSVVNLILRFIDEPTSGNIYIGGINIKEYDLAQLRNIISFIPQEVTIFDDTIKNNIAFGSQKNATMDEIREAAYLADAEGFIKRLPQHYHFRVGEGGTMLSGGQRQRIMIARALMKKEAKILLFDETFSALDVKTREEVLHNLYTFSKSKTTIIISNIFSIISAADHVIILNQGKVIYDGKPSHLQKETSLYRIILENN